MLGSSLLNLSSGNTRKISAGLSGSSGTRTNDYQQRWVIYTKHSAAMIVREVALQCGSWSSGAWVQRRESQQPISLTAVTSFTRWSSSAERLDPRKTKRKISLRIICPKCLIAWNTGFPQHNPQRYCFSSIVKIFRNISHLLYRLALKVFC